MDTSKYTWNNLLFTADILIQKGELSEEQLKRIFQIVDIEKVVKNNILSDSFIESYVKPYIEKHDEEYDSMTMYDVYKRKI
jgi:hypothetical protein